MNIYLASIVSLITGGLAGSLLTMIHNTRIRFWSRFADFQKIVFENPFLYPIWDQAGSPDPDHLALWNSSFSKWTTAEDYMDSLKDDEKYRVLTFVELWGDFLIESNNFWYHIYLGRFKFGFTERALEICTLYDLFPAQRKERLKQTDSEGTVPNGRNGVIYSMRSIKILNSSNTIKN